MTHGTVRATIEKGPPIGPGLPLRPDADQKISRVVVDTHLHLPDMFEITFLDNESTVIDDAGLTIGTPLKIFGGAPDSPSAELLIHGEVTSIEGFYEENLKHTIVRGYEKTHRLQRVRKTRTFVNMSDSDIASMIAMEHQIPVEDVSPTMVIHSHVSQINQTDWEFLKGRAFEIGYEVGASKGKFFFRTAPGMTGGGLGGAASAAAGAAASAAGLGGPPKLEFGGNLLWFRPRLASAGLVPEVEVRVWDPKNAEVIVGRADVASKTAEVDKDAADLAGSFGGLGIPIPSLPSIPGLSRGPTPSSEAHITVDRPVAYGLLSSQAVDLVAAGIAEHVGSTFAEAEGYAEGHPGIMPGKQIEVDQVALEFKGKWYVTRARHIFDDERGGYHVHFEVSGRQERSLLGLTSMGATHGPGAQQPKIDGLVCGIVTNLTDLEGLGRVKVALPWLSPAYESDWARVMQIGTGKSQGSSFLPEVGDEVLVGFEMGDPRRPFVIGGLVNSSTDIDLGGDPVKPAGPLASVVRRGFASRAGHKLVFDDDPRPTGMKSGLTLGTKDDSLSLKIDQINGKVALSCKPSAPASTSPAGTITIEVNAAGTINIKAGTGGTVNIDGGASLNLKALTSVKIESGGVVEIKGTTIKLN